MARNKVQMHLWVDENVHAIYKRSGMYASKIFEFGLTKGDSAKEIRELKAENEELIAISKKWSEKAKDRQEQIEFLTRENERLARLLKGGKENEQNCDP